MNSLSDKIHEIITRECEKLKQDIGRLEKCVNSKGEQFAQLTFKCDSLEHYSCRNNLRIFSIQEDKSDDL